MRPEFSFESNSTEGDDRSGVAVWRYTIQQRGKDVGHTLRQSFGTFAEAHEMNNLISVAWAAGVEAGHRRLLSRIDAALQEHR